MQLVKVVVGYISSTAFFLFQDFINWTEESRLPYQLDLDQVHHRLKLIARLFHAELNAPLVWVQVVVIHYSKKGAPESQALVRRQDYKLGEEHSRDLILRGLALLVFDLLKHRCKSNDFVVHVAHKVIPVGIIVDKTCSINVELEYCLEPTVDFLEVVGVSSDLDHLEHLLDWLLASDRLTLVVAADGMVLVDRDLPFEVRYLLASEGETFILLLFQSLDEEISAG